MTQCCTMIADGSYRGHQCRSTAKVEHEGKHYCGKHDPVSVSEKNAARQADSIKRWAAETAANKAKAAALAEQKRRADCFDDLLAGLESLLVEFEKLQGAWPFPCNARDAAKRAIKKATGVKP